jgi:hypothetical protein
MESLQKALAQTNSAHRLSSAVDNVDKIIELLSAAREQVVGGWFFHGDLLLATLWA